jgi:hypothetical protein
MRRVLVAATLATAGLIGAGSVASATAFTVFTQDGKVVSATFLGLLPGESCVLAAVDGTKHQPSDFDTPDEVINADSAIVARPAFVSADSAGPILKLSLDFTPAVPGKYIALAFCYTSDGDGVDAISTKEITIGDGSAPATGQSEPAGIFGS